MDCGSLQRTHIVRGKVVRTPNMSTFFFFFERGCLKINQKFSVVSGLFIIQIVVILASFIRDLKYKVAWLSL